MKLICMFDLPVETNNQKKEYRQFRTTLIKQGFSMIQYSVYVRTCPNREYATKFIKKLKLEAPPEGNVRIFRITEAQFNDMFIITGSKSINEELVGSKRTIKL